MLITLFKLCLESQYICKIRGRIVSIIIVKSGWVDDNTNILMPIHSADDLGFSG